MANQRINTERLILRRWKLEDHAPFAEICSAPQVMQFIGDCSIRTAEQASQSILRFEREWDEKGYGLFAVEEVQTGDLLGFTGLSWPNFLPEVLPSVEIGWRYSKSSWGKGYASEAAVAALSFGVTELGITDIVSIYQIGNGASVRIMQKLGMVFDRKTAAARLKFIGFPHVIKPGQDSLNPYLQFNKTLSSDRRSLSEVWK